MADLSSPVADTAMAAADALRQQLVGNVAIAKLRYRWMQATQILTALTAAGLAAYVGYGGESQLMAAGVLCSFAFVLLFALAQRFKDGRYWQRLAAEAASLDRSQVFYRTLLQCHPERDPWLWEQTAQVQQRLGDSLGGGWILHSVKISPAVDTADWLPADYLRQRLAPQIRQAQQAVSRYRQQRLWLRGSVYGCAALWGLLPLLGWDLAVAAVAPLALGLGLWIEFLRLNPAIEAASHLQRGLEALRSRGLAAAEAQFFPLVAAAEEQIANFYAAPRPLTFGEARDLVADAVAQPLPAELMVRLQPSPEVEAAAPAPEAAPPAPISADRGRPHAFVVMPFGRKQGPDGRWIDFNRIYSVLIKPALEMAGFEPFRADEEAASGDILTDMFQELLLADLVIADLSIDNANVFYELGIRHAMRKRGVVHIQAGRAYMPFDIFNVRTLPYHCDDSGGPDPAHVEKDRQLLVGSIQATWQSERHLPHSPVFNLLTGLSEPDRKALRTPLATGYWSEYNTLQARIAIAQRQKHIGDVVLLAEEVNNPLIKEDIIGEAAAALESIGNSALALKEYQQGLGINPENIAFRGKEAALLHRLGQSDEAIVKLERLLREHPTCVEATTYLARIFKDLWRQQWAHLEDPQARLHAAYDSSHLLQKAIENYLRGYSLDQNEYYPAINALTLSAILEHLVQSLEMHGEDPIEASYRQRLPVLRGSVQFCLESALERSPSDPWAALSLGDLAVCVESAQRVTAAYKRALTLLWNNKYALKAALGQLQLLQRLQFRPEQIQAGISVLEAELHRYEHQEQQFHHGSGPEATMPRQVLLFAGHMIDRVDRAKPRFPAPMELEAKERIEAALDKLGANENCIAITPGAACGGDILFLEACLRRNLKAQIYLPFDTAEFIQTSVAFAGNDWVERFYTVINHPNVSLQFQLDRLGPVPASDNAFERNNRWALYSTLMYDIDRVRLIVLWNGEGGDAPGGTGDMVAQVRQLGGLVEHIDTTQFDHWQQREEGLTDSSLSLVS